MYAPFHPHRVMGHTMSERTRLLALQQQQGGGLTASAGMLPFEPLPIPTMQNGVRPSGTQPGQTDSPDAICCPNRLDAFFKITERDSTIAQEVRAGCVTFVTMAYILIVNAQILSQSGPDSHGVWMHFDSIVAATAISSAIGSALVGVWGNLPFGLAPGMGLNSYFTYGICLKLGVAWPVALATCFMQGILLILLSLVGACDLLQQYAPPCIKKSITVGLGLFQALIGFELMRLVIPGTETLLSVGDLTDLRIYLSMGGLMIICILLVWKVKAAMLVGMLFITIVAWILQLAPPPTALLEMPSLQRPFAMLDFAGYFEQLSVTLPVTLVMLFVSVFDTAGVQYMCGTQADLMDPETDTLPGAKAAFCSAGIATTIGALLGTSPVIIHNETVAGISDGARTGLHSVTVAVLFLLSIPFVPIFRSVPPIAAAAPLVVVGMCMLMGAKYIDWEKTHEAMPAFLCATVLPFTYSIANGMLVGIIAYAVLKSAHKLGELLAPERFKTLVKCTAIKCECEACLTAAANLSVAAMLTSTPKRLAHQRKGMDEVFEDPMVRAPGKEKVVRLCAAC